MQDDIDRACGDTDDDGWKDRIDSMCDRSTLEQSCSSIGTSMH